MEKDRREKCKCGRFIVWSTEQSEVICRFCKTKYHVDCDSVLVYWLTEKIGKPKPWTTEAKY